jgi:plasmid stabilization system protein ParE
MKTFKVVLLDEAEEDLSRLQELLIAREYHSDAPDWSVADRALEAVTRGLAKLSKEPFLCRRALRGNPFERELIIPFGRTGYVALFEVRTADTVIATAVRHQLEQDYFQG